MRQLPRIACWPFAFVFPAALLLIAVANTFAWGADATFFGKSAKLFDADFAAELRLGPSTKAKLADWAERREETALEMAVTNRSLSEAEQAERLATFVAQSERQAVALLNFEERRRLAQADRTLAPLVSRANENDEDDEFFDDEDDFDDDEFDDEQAFFDEYEALMDDDDSAPPRDKPDMEQAADDDSAADDSSEANENEEIADDENVTEDKAPATDDDKDERPATPRTEPQRTPEPPSRTTPPSRGGPSRFSPPSRSGETPRGSDATRGSEPSRTGGPSTAPGATGTAATRAAERDPNRPLVPLDERRLRFNFRYAPWKDVLDWFASQADLSLQYETAPPGTFNYTDTREYSPLEAIDLLNGVLLTKGYTLVRRERMLILVNVEDQIPPSLVQQVDVSKLDQLGEYELVRTLFTVRRITAEEAQQEISKLIGPQGSIVILPKARQLLVTETAGKLRTIRSVIEAIESPRAENTELTEIKLANTTPVEIMPIVRQMMGMPEGSNAMSDGSLRIAIDPLGTRLLVSGEPEKLNRLRQLVALLDIPGGAKNIDLGPIETPQLEVYAVRGADPNSVLQVLQTILAGAPDVRLAVDPLTGNLIVLGPPSVHATVRAFLEQIQRDGREIDVFRLNRLDPLLAVAAVKKLFGITDDSDPNKVPQVEADTISRQLLMRGTQTQLAQIRELLNKMGEDGQGDPLSGVAGRANTRLIPLTGAAASDAISQIEQIWPVMSRNKIRIVTPSNNRNGTQPQLQPSLNDDSRAAPQRIRMPAGWIPPGDRVTPSVPASTSSAPTSRGNGAGNSNGDDRRGPPGDRFERRERGERGEGRERFEGRGRDPEASRGAASPFRFVTERTETAQPAELTEEDIDRFIEELNSENGPAEDDDREPAEIVIAVGPNGILIASDDLDALDEFESLLRSISDRAQPTGREYTVFYLKYASAVVAGELLKEVLGATGTVDDGGGMGGGGLLGDLAGGLLGGGGGLFGSLLGGGGGLPSIPTSGTVTFVADRRLNALIVQANAADLELIEQLLEVIDQESSPEDVQTVARPRLIPVENTSAEEVANVVRQVYASRMAGGAGQAQRPPSPDEFMAALRGGGRGGRGGGGANRAAEEEQQKLTIGVDTRSNSLIVSAPEPLFQEIKELVAQLDKVDNSQTTTRVIVTKRANPQVLQQALTSIVGPQVRTNTTQTPAQQQPGRGGQTTQRGGSGGQAGGNPFQQQMQGLQMIETIQRLQQQRGGGAGGFQPGGGRGGFQGGGRGTGGRGR